MKSMLNSFTPEALEHKIVVCFRSLLRMVAEPNAGFALPLVQISGIETNWILEFKYKLQTLISGLRLAN